jgi:hypothetical protein
MDKVLSLLQAMVTGDMDGAERYRGEITDDMWKERSGDILNAAFYILAKGRFGGQPVESIVLWVADVRSRIGDDADELDPRYGEWMVRGAVNDELDLLRQIPPDDYTPIQLLFATQLLEESGLAGEYFERFCTEAETLAARWANE